MGPSEPRKASQRFCSSNPVLVAYQEPSIELRLILRSDLGQYDDILLTSMAKALDIAEDELEHLLLPGQQKLSLLQFAFKGLDALRALPLFI